MFGQKIFFSNFLFKVMFNFLFKFLFFSQRKFVLPEQKVIQIQNILIQNPLQEISTLFVTTHKL